MTSTLTFSTLPRVLFVGHDASSPQIAASLLGRLAGDRVKVDARAPVPAAGPRSAELDRLRANVLDLAALDRAGTYGSSDQ
jgi:hypothetical protein